MVPWKSILAGLYSAISSYAGFGIYVWSMAIHPHLPLFTPVVVWSPLQCPQGKSLASQG